MYTPKILLVGCLLMACTGNTTCPAEPDQAVVELHHTIRHIPDIPGGTSVPNAAVEFDYHTTENGKPVTCRLVWIGSYQGGPTTLWCK